MLRDDFLNLSSRFRRRANSRTPAGSISQNGNKSFFFAFNRRKEIHCGSIHGAHPSIHAYGTAHDSLAKASEAPSYFVSDAVVATQRMLSAGLKKKNRKLLFLLLWTKCHEKFTNWRWACGVLCQWTHDNSCRTRAYPNVDLQMLQRHATVWVYF